MEYHTLSNCYKLVYTLAIGYDPVHNVATREKRLFGSEHAFVHFYLILDLDADISRN